MLEKKMYISAKNAYRFLTGIIACMALYGLFIFAKNKYSNPDFGKTFGLKAETAKQKLLLLKENFELCSKLCGKSPAFMQAIVFPEVMRYHQLKDGIEAESLRTLYVQFGEEYANFSIGLFQMKPTFAVQVEEKAKQLLSDSVYHELELDYAIKDKEEIRRQRVERLQDTDWQLIYLTAFISICDKLYDAKVFISETEKLQWYSTVYNAGFNKTDEYVTKKIEQENFYLHQGMPKKEFKYAAIAGWYYNQ